MRHLLTRFRDRFVVSDNHVAGSVCVSGHGLTYIDLTSTQTMSPRLLPSHRVVTYSRVCRAVCGRRGDYRTFHYFNVVPPTSAIHCRVVPPTSALMCGVVPDFCNAVPGGPPTFVLQCRVIPLTSAMQCRRGATQTIFYVINTIIFVRDKYAIDVRRISVHQTVGA